MEKLIRDKLLTLKSAREAGKQLRIAGEEEKKDFLMQKLKEEVQETLVEMEINNVSKITEEVADVLEVLESILSQYKISKKDLNQVKSQKKKNKGGFKKFFILKL